MADNSQCIDPAQVFPEDIPAYREGEGRDAFVTHLQNCPFCQNEVKEYGVLEGMLQTKLGRQRPEYRAACTPSQLLVDYLYGLLDAPKAIEVEAHLAECVYCRDDYTLLQTEVTGSPEAVAEVLQEAATRAARLVIARLISSPAPEFARRASSSAPDNERVFEAEDVIIIMRRYEAKTGQTLQGTISREAPAPAFKAVLLQNNNPVAEADVDEAGIFSFENLSMLESLTLEIRFPDMVILIPNLV